MVKSGLLLLYNAEELGRWAPHYLSNPIQSNPSNVQSILTSRLPNVRNDNASLEVFVASARDY